MTQQLKGTACSSAIIHDGIAIYDLCSKCRCNHVRQDVVEQLRLLSDNEEVTTDANGQLIIKLFSREMILWIDRE
jgi:hypothetical protein